MLVSKNDSWLSLSPDSMLIVSWISDIVNTCQLIYLLFTVVDYPMLKFDIIFCYNPTVTKTTHIIILTKIHD